MTQDAEMEKQRAAVAGQYDAHIAKDEAAAMTPAQAAASLAVTTPADAADTADTAAAATDGSVGITTARVQHSVLVRMAKDAEFRRLVVEAYQKLVS